MASVERVRCSGRRLRRARCTVLSVRRICCGGRGLVWRASEGADEGVSEGPTLWWTRAPVKQIRCGGPWWRSRRSGAVDKPVAEAAPVKWWVGSWGFQGAEGRSGGVWGPPLRRRTRFGGLPWLGGSGRGRGGALGKNVGGKEGKTMELPKQPFSVHVAGVKQEYRRAKLSGAWYFDVSGKFESFWHLKL